MEVGGEKEPGCCSRMAGGGGESTIHTVITSRAANVFAPKPKSAPKGHQTGFRRAARNIVYWLPTSTATSQLIVIMQRTWQGSTVQ